MPIPPRVAVYLADVDRAVIIDALEAFAKNHALTQSEVNRAQVMAEELTRVPKDVKTEPEHQHHYQHVGLVNAEHQTVVYKLYCVTCAHIVELDTKP